MVVYGSKTSFFFLNDFYLRCYILLCFSITVSSSLPALNQADENQNQIGQSVEVCDSKIYCQGPILKAVNDLSLFSDPKYYVDMPLLKSPDETLADFHKQFPSGTNITKEDLSDFVNSHFDQAGKELAPFAPLDWQPEPKTFNLISDPHYKKWAKELNSLWLKLCKKVNESVAKRPEFYSLIYVPNEFVIPGGRFREFYYWDTYWIILGLLHSEMYHTAKAMIKNYEMFVKDYGFVPNGGRKYYLKRSQPPMLIRMVKSYYEKTGDRLFLAEILPALEKELQFWKLNRSRTLKDLSDGRSHVVYQYNTPSNVPRPESYRLDVKTAADVPERDPSDVYSSIASTAESGWDFSSRWFGDHKYLSTVKTKQVLPVDLNAFVCGNMKILAYLFGEIDSWNKSIRYAKEYETMTDTMMQVFYNETTGVWFDYHLDTNLHNSEFYVSNIIPLYTECYKFSDYNKSIDAIYDYLLSEGVLKYPNGVPTSLIPSEQQWDFPNVWPPLTHMLVESMYKSGNLLMQETAYKRANTFLQNIYAAYNKSHAHPMFEKYNVEKSAVAGSGGEYQVQTGFGWTNGVVLDFLIKYGSRLVANGA